MIDVENKGSFSFLEKNINIMSLQNRQRIKLEQNTRNNHGRTAKTDKTYKKQDLFKCTYSQT
jgi:hypothetical protein